MKIAKVNSNFSPKCTIHLPSSKSISNRALILQAIYPNIVLENLSNANDTLVLQSALLDIKNKKREIDIEDAGTAFRFLTAYLAITEGEWILKGSERLHQRPIAPLVDALVTLGADITYLESPNFAPLLIRGKKLNGGDVSIEASVSSQFITALLLIGSTLDTDLNLNLEGEIVSSDYITSTISTLNHCGIHAEYSGQKISVLRTTELHKINQKISIESDWSAASYIYSIVALSNDAEIYIPNLLQDSWQGDAVIANIMSDFGVETIYELEGIRIRKKHVVIPSHYEYDFIRCPDLAQTIIVLCAALSINGSFKGLQTLRSKETDRIAALQIELSKIGCELIEENSIFHLKKCDDDYENKNLKIATYHDHRMAMSFAPLALKYALEIENENVVKKSFPNFWKELLILGFEIETT